MSAPIVELDQVRKQYGVVRAVDGVSLQIAPGEFFALLGPSGCGKTTLMRMVAGFETPDAGRILIDGVDMLGVPAYRRPVNMMFQSYALFPHMNVVRNIGFGLVQAGMNKADIAARVAQMLRLTRLEGLGERMPDQLSGGQRQRVALARALAPRPKLLLLDEPLAALDRKLREDTQFELMQVQRDLSIAFMLVTHDQDEAMAMAQRIAVMREGRIEQTGAPRVIYEQPQTHFVAQFIGDMNFFDAEVVEENGVRVARAPALPAFAAPIENEMAAARAMLAVRPEHMRISREATGGDGEISGEISEVAFLGDIVVWRVRTAQNEVVRVSGNSMMLGKAAFARGDKVFVGFDRTSVRVLAP